MKAEKPKHIIFRRTESLLQSLVSDTFTFSLMGLCIYVSQGSTWWTFFTGLMAIFFLFAKANAAMDNRTTKLHSKAEALEWANSLEDDGGTK